MQTLSLQEHVRLGPAFSFLLAFFVAIVALLGSILILVFKMSCRLTLSRIRGFVAEKGRRLTYKGLPADQDCPHAPDCRDPFCLHVLSATLATMSNRQREVIALSDSDEEIEEEMDVEKRPRVHQTNSNKPETDTKTECRQAVLNIFPDICPQYLEDLAVQHAYNHETLLSAILDQVEGGKPFPKRANLKRKRESEDVGDRLCDLRKKYDNPEWRQEKKSKGYVTVA